MALKTACLARSRLNVLTIAWTGFTSRNEDDTVKKEVSGLEIRMAGVGDAIALSEMIRDFAAFERLPNAATADSVRTELSCQDRVMNAVIALLDGKPVGFATFFQTYSTFAARRGLYLEDIYVREGARNRGIATEILRFIAKHAIECHFARVEFTVLLWNNIAIEFFETLGATPNSAWTSYRLTGEWLEKLAND
jgi:GNAT superfamily N-acetyltransferase